VGCHLSIWTRMPFTSRKKVCIYYSVKMPKLLLESGGMSPVTLAYRTGIELAKSLIGTRETIRSLH